MAMHSCEDPQCGHGSDSAIQPNPKASGEALSHGRRDFIKDTLTASAGLIGLSALSGCASMITSGAPADILLVNGRIATLDRKNSMASALAIRGDSIAAVGTMSDLARLQGPSTRVIDLAGRTVVPGLNDAHTHFIRGGLTYSMEVRWDGLPSLADGLRMLREQARRTPSPHWVQVIGGWTWAQFAEKRFPTLDEINAATGDTPAMVMHLYDRAWVNRAGLKVLGWNKDTPNPFGGVIERDASGNPTGLLAATVGLVALVGAWLKIPRLSEEDQAISTRHFMREHNRLGITSVIDAGGGGQNYPDNYQAIAKLASDDQLTLRIGYTLFAQAGGRELENYQKWSKMVKLGQGNDYFRMIGAGEYIVWAAGDVTNFAKDAAPIPPVMESQLTAVAKFISGERWPFRMHASFDYTAARILNVLEQVNREVPLKGLRWGLDHCETIQPKTLERVAALGGSINIQNRMSTDGEAFVKKYGEQVAADAPPIARIRGMGIPLAAGTDANRANTYNPWVGVHWLITGQTLGGAKLNGKHNLLDRNEALRLYTSGGAWVASEESHKGTLEVGKLADLVVLSADYFNIPEEAIKELESVMTVVGGKVVYASGAYASLAPAAPPIAQDWLPIKSFGQYYKRAGMEPPLALAKTVAAASTHQHPQIIGDSGAWGMECPCSF